MQINLTKFTKTNLSFVDKFLKKDTKLKNLALLKSKLQLVVYCMKSKILQNLFFSFSDKKIRTRFSKNLKKFEYFLT